MRRNIEKELKYILEKLSKSVEKRWKICEKRVHIGKRRGAALRKLYLIVWKYFVSKFHENVNDCDAAVEYEINKSVLCKWNKNDQEM